MSDYKKVTGFRATWLGTPAGSNIVATAIADGGIVKIQVEGHSCGE